MNDWYKLGVPDCVNCANIKYLYDNSTTICLTCRKYNGGGWMMPDHWEPVPGSELDILQKKLKSREVI